MPDVGSSDRATPSWRRFGPVVLLGVASAGLLAVAAGRTWATATPRAGDAVLGAHGSVEVTGADVAPLVLPLALVALASWGAVLVLRRRGRRVVAVLGVLAAGGAAVTAALLAHTAPDVAGGELGDVPADLSTSVWPWVAVVAGLVAATAFVLAWLAAPRWPEMSSKYDAPGEVTPSSGSTDARDLWKAMDEGHDPTR